MSRLIWDKLKDRTYETGTDHGVLYLRNHDGTYGEGTVWNGLTAVTINPSGGEATAFWADNAKYLNILSAEELGFTIEAYSYPKDFRVCFGRRQIVEGITVSQQKRESFGFSFRSKVGNPEAGDDYSYKIHVIYGCMASPSSKSYSTVNDSPEALTLSWEVSTLPVVIEGAKPTSEFVFDGLKYKQLGIMNILHAIENVLYGTDETDPRLPSMDEIQEIYVYQRYMLDSDGEDLLDSSGNKMMGAVYD